MSNFLRLTLNPKTKKMEMATWMDNYFEQREYGVKFPDGEVYREEDLFKTFKGVASTEGKVK